MTSLPRIRRRSPFARDAGRRCLQRHHAARRRRLRRVRQRQDGAQVQLGPVTSPTRRTIRRTRRPIPASRSSATCQNRQWTRRWRQRQPGRRLRPAEPGGERRVRRRDRHRRRTSARLGAATQVNPGVLSGWGVRPGDYQYTVTLQQELMPRVSADVSYTHRSFHGFFVTDDLNRRAGGVASYYETYTLTAPQDSRLRGRRRLPDHGVRPDGRGQRRGPAALPDARNRLRSGARQRLGWLRRSR